MMWNPYSPSSLPFMSDEDEMAPKSFAVNPCGNDVYWKRTAKFCHHCLLSVFLRSPGHQITNGSSVSRCTRREFALLPPNFAHPAPRPTSSDGAACRPKLPDRWKTLMRVSS